MMDEVSECSVVAAGGWADEMAIDRIEAASPPLNQPREASDKVGSKADTHTPHRPPDDRPDAPTHRPLAQQLHICLSVGWVEDETSKDDPPPPPHTTAPVGRLLLAPVFFVVRGIYRPTCKALTMQLSGWLLESNVFTHFLGAAFV